MTLTSTPRWHPLERDVTGPCGAGEFPGALLFALAIQEESEEQLAVRRTIADLYVEQEQARASTRLAELAEAAPDAAAAGAAPPAAEDRAALEDAMGSLSAQLAQVREGSAPSSRRAVDRHP